MNGEQAEIIIRSYGTILARDSNIFRKESSLPLKKEKLKKVFIDYVAEIKRVKGAVPKEMADVIVSSYAAIGTFIPDKEADRLNKIGFLIKEGKAEKMESDEYLSRAMDAVLNLEVRREIESKIFER